MDNTNNPQKSSHKYEDLIKLRKAKLEKMRKERELLQYEKLKRASELTQEKFEEIRLKNEISEKAKQINDLEINKIQSEINKLQENAVKIQKIDTKIQTSEKELSPASKMLHLECSHVQITEFPPILTPPKYSKYTQTDHSRLYIRNEVSVNNDFEEDDMEYHDKVSPLKLRCKFSSILPPGILSPGLPNVMDIAPALTPIDKENPWKYLKEKNKKLLEEKSEMMLLSEDFHNSLKRVSITMERVISRNKNICIDYTSSVIDDDLNNNSHALLKLNHIFKDQNITNNRCITSIDWCPNNTGQLAAAYYKNQESPFDSGEDVIVWNQNSETPIHKFECHSSVMSICFTKFNVNLIIGATYSGQIVLWDKRVKSSIPTQSTKLNCKGHSYPIYCLRVIGDDSSHNLISISSDGKLCSWNLDMLGLPLDVMQVELKVSDIVKKPIAITCMDFPANGANNLVMGGEDGCAYTAFRNGYDSCINNSYEKHDAPITSICSHFNKTSTEFRNLFLTSSIDSTIKLWSLEKQKPLHTFKNNYDYAMDVAWSPIHPAVFVTGDGNGCLDLYNINRNIEEPMISLNTKEQRAINRLKWDDNGQYIAVGTEMGELYVYNVAEDLANPFGGEWCRFNNVLKDLNVNYEIECE